ncbi:putative dihydroxyacetone kinase subunit 2 [Actinacidiphila reveromycinica]|uniref:Putative dihydroxyacetone kinase subunit 2 n=1 Tax=Actinacidiphila reveromycinica TaxID=659352 RepID=A0A7U3VNU0_9ACTN|nr:DAK2 domain-containing protein [Streptomyces sp. SN-593]BBA97974.1 putative dihydroxyacetone kinase subunit 2 [Streptomyces sp. SN-593]
MLTSTDTGFPEFSEPFRSTGFTDFTEGWVRRFAASAAATEAELTALDQQVGDGDFGANLVAGLQAALRRLGAPGVPASPPAVPASPAVPAPPAWPLEAAASAFLDEVGGTSGPLFGLLLQEIAVSVAAGDGPPAVALATGAGGGLAAIQRVGEAAVGDKTLVDALAPACDALAAQARTAPGDPSAAAAEGARAAWGGVRSTARFTARRGRASYLGERAAGVPDPGAVGIALLFASAATTVPTLAPYLG